MNQKIDEIIHKTLEGQLLSAEELKELFSVDYLSEEAFKIQYASRKISEKSNQGRAEIHGQVGLNIAPCPKNCLFCSFAACNKVFPEPYYLTVEEAVEQSLAFEAEGANAVYLMATANYRWQDFLVMGKEVRQALKGETILIANIADFNEKEAQQLVEIGFNGIYHALRLREGTVTDLEPAKRKATIKKAQKAGLRIGTCVEPVGPEHTVEELIEATLFTRSISPAYSGAGRRITIPGAPLEKFGMVNEGRMAHLLAVVRLGTGYDIPGNCTHEPGILGAMAGANILWAESGTNPRDTKEKTESHRGFTVDKCQKIFWEAGWEVLEGPSLMYRHKGGRD